MVQAGSAGKIPFYEVCSRCEVEVCKGWESLTTWTWPVASEVLEAWKKVENSVVSFAAVGISIDTEVAGEADTACSTAQNLISSLFPAALATLRSDDEEVASSLVPFLQTYVAKLKANLKRGGLLSQVTQISRIGSLKFAAIRTFVGQVCP
jgi:hypothetical protein